MIRTLEQAIDKKINLYSDSAGGARLKTKNLFRLELLVHGDFKLYAYNTPKGSLSLGEIAQAGAAYYAGQAKERQIFDRIWIFYSLNPAREFNELLGFPQEAGRLRWLAELWPDYGINPRSIG